RLSLDLDFKLVAQRQSFTRRKIQKKKEHPGLAGLEHRVLRNRKFPRDAAEDGFELISPEGPNGGGGFGLALSSRSPQRIDPHRALGEIRQHQFVRSVRFSIAFEKLRRAWNWQHQNFERQRLVRARSSSAKREQEESGKKGCA